MQDNFLSKLLPALLLIFLGVLAGIMLSPYMPGIDAQVVLAIGLILILITSYMAIKIYFASQKRSIKTLSENREKSEVGFVVDTFQELVGKLKEKEKELERLRTLAEDRAVRMESYNENILQSVPSGVISTDNSMVIKSINYSAERVLGVKAEDVINRDCKEVFNEPLISVFENSKTLNRGEYPYVTSDGRHIWLGVTASQLKNATDETIGLIMVFTDLTEVKALQSQVELKKRLTQLGEMSAGIAHELRNPMSVIAGYAKLLNKKVEASNKATVNAILTEIDHIDKIISEFLAFAKPTDLNKASIDLTALIEESVKTVIADNKTINASFAKCNDPVNIMADEFMLRQALTNILINAVESMPDGGNMMIELNSTGDRIELSISDTGPGIPEDIKQKIFLPFYTSKQDGIGLGLAIVQKVIVSHGGTIEVDSKKGKGTTFLVTLPVSV